jgi:hypothetical protein
MHMIKSQLFDALFYFLLSLNTLNIYLSILSFRLKESRFTLTNNIAKKKKEKRSILVK